MKFGFAARLLAGASAALLSSLQVSLGDADTPRRPGPSHGSSLWSHDNLLAWCVVPFDANKRGPEERAQMLESLGFKHFAYDWRDKDIPTFDAEIEALQRHGIELTAWWFPLDPDDPQAKNILETFKRHHVHPQLWVIHSLRGFPKTPEEWAKLLPKGVKMPSTAEEANRLSEADKAAIQKVWKELSDRFNGFTKAPEEQAQRVDKEARRILAFVKLAEPYGSKVELYNHNGWFGNMENEVAIIKRVKQLGVHDVGIVYNFSHARDEQHDDSRQFPAIWKMIEPYVVVVNVTGIGPKGEELYLSDGDSDLAMLRIIQKSGWRGRVGLQAEKGGDAEVTLRNYLKGLDWLAAELRKPGSGGAKPLFAAAQ